MHKNPLPRIVLRIPSERASPPLMWTSHIFTQVAIKTYSTHQVCLFTYRDWILSFEIHVQELVNDVHCIIEAMIGRSSDVLLMKPQLEDLPQHMMGDSDRLKGILLNLYTNAAKFTRQGAIALKVGIHGPEYRPSPADNAALHQAVATLRKVVIFFLILSHPPSLSEYLDTRVCCHQSFLSSPSLCKRVLR